MTQQLLRQRSPFGVTKVDQLQSIPVSAQSDKQPEKVPLQADDAKPPAPIT
jgi:hypothetical protein